MSIVISLEQRRNIARALDCQGEAPTYAAKLTDQLNRIKLGLNSGMKPAEIRDAEADQCEALIENAAKRLQELRTPTQAAMFFSKLAIKMNDEVAL